MLVYRSVPDNYQLWLDIQNLLGGWWGWISLIIRNHSLWGITMSATIVSDHMIGEYRVSAVWTLEWDNLMQASPSRRWFSCNGETHYTMSPFIHFQGCYLSWKNWWKFKKTNLTKFSSLPLKKNPWKRIRLPFGARYLFQLCHDHFLSSQLRPGGEICSTPLRLVEAFFAANISYLVPCLVNVFGSGFLSWCGKNS